jgi:hypothetical protein
LSRLLLILARGQLLPAGVLLAACLLLRPWADDGFLPLAVTGVAVVAVWLPLFMLTGLSRGERATLVAQVRRRLPGAAA